MGRKQKIGSETSATRTLLLDAAEAILREEGYAAVTSRRVSVRAGVSSKLVHYYFPTMDDLFLTLYRRTSIRFLAETEELLRSENPIKVLWQTSVHPGDVDLFAELMALGNHRKVIREELDRGLVRLREMQLAALDLYYARLGKEPPIDTAALLVLLAGAGLLISMEQRGSNRIGHEQTLALFERLCEDDGTKSLGAIFAAPREE
ncbi:TetR/AcrR family transcriptional regulator [Novosphingobium malaysiense]|uniref:TetR/AcrR family transcriptional regulator n=1 Tax=Novosphingobium malaysiense TaxID=1348853 RepID=UPI00068FB0D4|nr:TetR/AcrR family transcriptional regulator [Novosphingobium malaysiense]